MCPQCSATHSRGSDDLVPDEGEPAPRSSLGPDSADTALTEAREVEDVVALVTDGPGATMGRGAAWSLLNNIVGRLGNFLAGIVIIRLLSESEYGTYAVGLVVLSVLLSMNELGVSVAIVQREGSVDDIAPTVMTMSIVSSLVLSGLAFAAAPLVASLLNSPDATGIIRLMVLGVLIDGVAAVPNALITRTLQQRKRLIIDTVAFVVGTPVTIGLALAGFGAWSLGWGALIGNVTTAVLAFLWAPAKVVPGWDREQVRPLLRFGMPLAGSSLLLLLLLNVDYVVVGHTLGPAQLGLYLLAFNLSSWPITVIASAVRRVSLAAFARLREHGPDASAEGFSSVVSLTMAVVLPASAFLSLYAAPVVELLYGTRWLPAAEALRFLVVFGVGRVAVELAYDFLAAHGRTLSTVWLHLAWLVALVPALVVGVRLGGIAGVALAHTAVVVVVLAPLQYVVLRRAGTGMRRLARANVRPVIGTLLAMLSAPLVLSLSVPPAALITVGALVGVALYAPAVWPMRRVARELWNTSVG